jgi:hypothetical protein
VVIITDIWVYLNRSLALLLALLSDKHLSRPFHKAKARRVVKATRKKASIEQILLVPHTELAKQFEGWLDRLRTPVVLEDADSSSETMDASPDLPIDDLATSAEQSRSLGSYKPAFKPYKALQHTQVLHRQSTRAIDISTRFLITTPSYLIDILDSISTAELHTIALDEADEMLKLPNRFHTYKDEVKWQRHPPLLLAIMDEILSPAQKERKHSSAIPEKRIVAVSASANSVFRDYMVRRSGWLKAPSSSVDELREGDRQFDWYDFSSEPLAATTSGDEETQDISELQRVGRALMPQAQINHYIAKIDGQGQIVDEDPTPTEEFDNAANTPADADRFLVATATLFALNQVDRGLLLIPSTQSLKATLEFLQSVAVPAIGISQAFDTSKESMDPILYVASVDSVRGLDIPRLEWIFLTPQTKAHEDAKDYMHIAGRVGRLLDSQGTRGSGNVVSLIDNDNHRQLGKLQNVWQLLGIEGQAMQAEELAFDEQRVEDKQRAEIRSSVLV